MQKGIERTITPGKTGTDDAANVTPERFAELERLSWQSPQELIDGIDEILGEVADPVMRAKLRCLLGNATWRTGDISRGIAELAEATDALATHGTPEDHANALISLGDSRLNLLADIDGSIELIVAAREIAEDNDLPRTLGLAFNSLARISGLSGKPEDRLRLLRNAYTILGDRFNDHSCQLAKINFAYALMEGGEAKEALRVLRPLSDQLKYEGETDRERILPSCEHAMAAAYVRDDRPLEAIAVLEGLADRLDAKTNSFLWAEQALGMGEALLAAGRVEEAIATLQSGIEYARSKDMLGSIVESLELLISALEKSGRLTEALQTQHELREVEKRLLNEQSATRVAAMQASAQLREERAAREALANANAKLEERVAERTAALRSEISERESAELRAQYAADHDWLTNLYNRNRLHRALSEFGSGATGDAAQLAVLFVDIDGFKYVNDVYGHVTGDEVLGAIAQRLGDIAAAHDVYRFGGDEFVVVCSGAQTTLQLEARALGVAHSIRHAIAREFNCSGHQVRLTASVGIATSASEMKDPNELILHADRAMLRAKHLGGDRCELMDPNLHNQWQRRADLRRDLGPAIWANQLTPWFQPIVDAKTGVAHHVELLARWHHPIFGWVSPGEFIPIAEESGSISPLGRWALGEGIQMANDLSATVPITVGVNLSTFQLNDPGVVGDLLSVVAAKNGRPEQVTIEITESIQLGRDDAFRKRVEQLKDAGFTLAMDDFGCGYSSFEYLSRLRFDHLKIDRSLVEATDTTKEGRAVIDAIVAMARALGMIVVAEGIETTPQRDVLRSCGVDLLQGYLFAKPMCAEEIGRWLAANALTDGDAVTRCW